MIGLHQLDVKHGSQNGQLLVGGGGLREGFDEIAGKKIDALHGSAPEENDLAQNRRSGGGREMPRGIVVLATASLRNRVFHFPSYLTNASRPFAFHAGRSGRAS
jgi:hypothetical protein